MNEELNQAICSINSSLETMSRVMASEATKLQFSTKIGREFPFKLMLEYSDHFEWEFVEVAQIKTIALEVPRELRSLLNGFIIVSRYEFDAHFRCEQENLVSYVNLYLDDDLKEVYDQASSQHRKAKETLLDLRADYFEEYPEAKAG